MTSGKKIYSKFGIYWSYLKDLNDIDIESLPVHKVYYSTIKRSKTREGLLP